MKKLNLHVYQASFLFASLCMTGCGSAMRQVICGEQGEYCYTEPIPPLVASHAPVWKTIKIGTELKTSEALHSALTKKGYTISNTAAHILNNPAFTVSATLEEIDLVIITPQDLGFKKTDFMGSAVLVRARESGYLVCSPEVGIQLRLQYPEQPEGELIAIGMEPAPTTPDQLPGFFFLTHDKKQGLLIDGQYIGRMTSWYFDTKIVFIRPRK